MSKTITMQMQENSSLGTCWLVKLDDEDTGLLIDKRLYDYPDPADAFKAFVDDVVGGDFWEIGDIYIFDVGYDEEREIRSRFYKIGVEYRNMHTAGHHLLVFDWEDRELAESVGEELAELSDVDEQDYESVKDDAFSVAGDDVEVNFRHRDLLVASNDAEWPVYHLVDQSVIVVNSTIPDVW